MPFDRFKRALKAVNVYGETARRMEGGGTTGGGGSQRKYTSDEEQDRMKRDLESAREREQERMNLSSYKPPRKVKVDEARRRRQQYGVGGSQ